MRSLYLMPVILVVLSAASLGAQSRTVALTIDDLPFVKTDQNSGPTSLTAKQAATANRKLLSAVARHHIPVTGFVIERSVEQLGTTAGQAILHDWVRRGLDLANHSYEHPDFDSLTIEQFEDQVTRGEASFVPLMKSAGRTPRFFRFPFNHTGDTREKHDALAAFLAQHGYRVAPCTIETSDWMFAAAYGRILAAQDNASAARLRADYLAFTSAQIDYFSRLNKQVLGYDPPQIMLIHDNQLNADVIEDLLAIFAKKQFHFVSLADAEADPVYQAPDTFVTKFGPMWAYRWAKERNVKIDGSLEPEPPDWVAAYPPPKPVPARP